MTEEEKRWQEGYRAAMAQVLALAITHLGEDREKAELVLERKMAIDSLRLVCGRFGDNEWNDNLLLSDIIEKHLGRHLNLNREEANA